MLTYVFLYSLFTILITYYNKIYFRCSHGNKRTLFYAVTRTS